MTDKKCNCHSNNWDDPDSGKEYQVSIDAADYLSLAPKGTIVFIDPCIADVAKHLWSSGIWTLASCCGHNRLKPNFIFETNLSNEAAKKIKAVIAEVDDREFEILSWTLCKL